jgi:photosystem II stability/assembly factor-like uncharacterized protein
MHFRNAHASLSAPGASVSPERLFSALIRSAGNGILNVYVFFSQSGKAEVRMSLSRTLLVVVAVLFPVLLNAQPRWVDEGGPYGGSIVEIMKTSSGYLALPGNRTFVLLGSDDAQHWEQRSLPDGDAVASGLLESDGRLLVGGYSRVFLSDDGGANWRTVRVDWDNANRITTITRHGADIFAANASFMYRSTNNGDSWSRVSSGFPSRTMVSLGTVLIASDNGGVRRSMDNGLFWKRFELFPLKPLRLHSAPHGTVLLSTESASAVPAPNSVIYRSADSGLTWDSCMLAAQTINDITWSRGRWSVATGVGVFHSDDDGVTWTQGSAITPYARPVLSIEASGDTLLAGISGLGLWLSIGGGEWTYVSPGVFPIGVAQAASTTEGMFAFSLKENHLFFREAASTQWDMRHYPSAETPGGFLLDGGTVYLSVTGALLASSDAGRSWARVSEGLDDKTALQIIARSGEYLIVSIDKFGIARSKNGVGGWEHHAIAGLWRCFDLLAVGTTLYAGTEGGLYISGDDGASWVKFGFSLPIYRLAYADGRLIGATQDGVYIFDTLLQQSRLVYGNPAFAVAATRAGVFAITRDDRVIRFSPDLSSYEQYSEGLPPASFVDPTVCRAELKEIDGRLYIGACSLPGLFSLDLSTITSTEASPELPAGLHITSYFPAPATGRTSIEWSSAQGGQFSLELLDVLGRRVRVLADGMHEAGRHTAVLNTAGLRGGAYLCRLSSGVRQVSRVVVVR